MVYDFGVPDYHRYIAEGIVSHNCAETVQNPFEVCNLTHINLVKFVKDNCGGGSFEEKLGCIDWDGLAQAARVGTRFLDDAIDRSKTGIEVIDEMNAATRKNGLGIMGFAELLIKLGVPYASWEAVELINRIMGWIYVNALTNPPSWPGRKGRSSSSTSPYTPGARYLSSSSKTTSGRAGRGSSGCIRASCRRPGTS